MQDHAIGTDCQEFLHDQGSMHMKGYSSQKMKGLDSKYVGSQYAVFLSFQTQKYAHLLNNEMLKSHLGLGLNFPRLLLP